jgi:hypothetical protein
MTIEDNGKYVHLGKGYDKEWMFIKDDKELEEWKNDGSFEEDEIIVEVKAVYRVKKNVAVTFELEKVPDKNVNV